MRTPIIAGNWKMFKTAQEAQTFVRALKAVVEPVEKRIVVVCPPFTALAAVRQELQGSAIAIGAQNAHWETQGAFTGEVSAPMAAEQGCRYVVVGHSERRQFFGETDETVCKRMHAVLKAGLMPIVCIGETLKEREGNQTFAVIERQLTLGLSGLPADAQIVIAYEPVWAIGTGKTATPQQAQEVHAFIRKKISETFGSAFAERTCILYGGSVKPDNMSALMEQTDIDGGLVGGASLDVDSFKKIIYFDGVPAGR